jgi:hypothetical protein
VAIMLGNGSGTFAAPTEYQPFAFPGWTAVGDFNGDKSADLATTQVFDGHTVAVMLNSPSSTNVPPTLASEATAAPNPVTGKTTTLSALGADNGGESNLKYTWGTTISPVGPLTFSANGTNAAKKPTVTFTKAGTYYFKVTITDAAGLSVIGMIPVTVKSTLNSISVAPASASVAPGSTQQFTATAKDQFASALSSQPAFTWKVSGGGSISSEGLFTAGSTAGGPFTVTASSGSVSGTASVTVGTIGSFTWTGGGTSSNWSDAANWAAHAVPGSAATVVFNSTSGKNAIVDSAFAGVVGAVQLNSGYTGTVTLNRNLSITGGLTESAGTFNAGTYTLNIAGDFAKNGGTFNAGTSTVTINGTAANQNISAAGVSFYNFTLANSAHSLNVTGTLIVNGAFTWLRSAGWILGPNGAGNAAIECRGDVDDQNHGNTGTPYFTLDGTANQTIKDTSGVVNYTGFIGGDFRRLTINKASGSVILACDPLIYNGLSLLKGTVNTGSNFWLVGNEAVSTASGLNIGNLTLSGNVAAGVWSSGLRLTNLNLNGHTLVAPAVLYVSGNWNAGGSGSSFTANSGTVIFNGNGTQQKLTSAGNAFYNLTINSGASVQQQDDLSILGTFTDNGILDKNGHKLNGA